MVDYDADGDVDIFVLNLNDLLTLMRNDSDRGRYLIVRLVGEESNRDGIGASVSIGLGGRQQHAEVRSGTSYLSHNDMRLHFGVGQAEQLIGCAWIGPVVASRKCVISPLIRKSSYAKRVIKGLVACVCFIFCSIGGLTHSRVDSECRVNNDVQRYFQGRFAAC